MPSNRLNGGWESWHMTVAQLRRAPAAEPPMRLHEAGHGAALWAGMHVEATPSLAGLPH